MTKQPFTTPRMSDIHGVCTFHCNGQRHVIDFNDSLFVRAYNKQSRLVFQDTLGGHVIYMPYDLAAQIVDAWVKWSLK